MAIQVSVSEWITPLPGKTVNVILLPDQYIDVAYEISCELRILRGTDLHGLHGEEALDMLKRGEWVTIKQAQADMVSVSQIQAP